MIADEEVNAFLEHFGVKGMQWGKRKSATAKSPREERLNQIRKIDKKISKFDAERIYGGAGLTGNYQKRRQSKHPYGKARARLALRGATEAAVLLGGSTLAMKKMGANPTQLRGGQIAFGLLAAQHIGRTRISQIHDVGVYKRHTKLIEEKRRLTKMK